jgi:hypothetical protein
MEEGRLILFGNRILRTIFKLKWVKVRGGWGKWHNEELHCLRFSSDIITIFPAYLSGFVIGRYKQTNSVVLVRKRNITTERPPPVGEVTANFRG